MKRLARLFHAFPVATALRHSLHAGYGRRDLLADVGAGLSVGIIAVPLAMALAIASGVPPQHGLYTAAFAGALTALLGGSRYSVSGPTAAFVVILHPIAIRHGLGGLLTATLMAGAILTLMGAARMGTLIKYIPFPVTMGFTAGIAVVIASLQVKDLLGLAMEQPERFGPRLVEVGAALPTLNPADAAIGALALGIVLLFPRLKVPHLPAPLVAVVVATLAAMALGQLDPSHAPATIGSRFAHLDAGGLMHGGIPEDLPGLAWPWVDGLSLELVRALLGPAFAIALLAAIESLLCAVVVDSMTNTRHHADGELIGLGLANMVVPFLGGIAATGAIARSAANVRYGARTPIAAAVHGLFVLLVLVSLGALLDLMPMAALAALLLVVAWNMGEFDRIRHVLRFAPRSDLAVLMVCFLLTVFVDMVFAVGVGVVLAALLFMRRMAEMVQTQAVMHGAPGGKRQGDAVPVPPHTAVFHISGPLFFGAADKAASVIDLVDPGVRTVVLDLSAVPMIDASGAVALEAAVTRLRRHRVLTILAGVNGQPRRVLARVGLTGARHELRITRSLGQALRIAARAEERKMPLP